MNAPFDWLARVACCALAAALNPLTAQAAPKKLIEFG
jgi:hypothetical protein